MSTLPGLIAIFGTKIVNTVLTVAAVVMMSYSGLVLYDTVYTNRAAFISDDLSQYRPALTEEEPDFEGMEEVNPETRAWIVLRDTNIDYPIVQGKDDVEYSMKDVYGQSSLTGSIYLASVNDKNFTDSFNMIYGHHMDNGAMFGDIDKYENMSYFFRHQEGLLITQRGAYDLHVFARLSADAYDSNIYNAGDHPASDFPNFLYYIHDLALQWDPMTDIEGITENIRTYIIARDKNIKENGKFVFKKMPEKAVNNGMQLVALSTCADATTNGRQVLVATMKFRTKPLPDYYTKKYEEAAPLTAWGHKSVSNWALLNAICVILILIMLLPGRLIGKKYGPLYKSVKKYTKRKSANEGAAVSTGADVFIAERQAGATGAAGETLVSMDMDEHGTVTAERNGDEVVQRREEQEATAQANKSGKSSKHKQVSFMDRLGIFGRPEVAGVLLQILIAIFAVVWFYLTENIRQPMVIVDYWTPGMIVLAFIMWVIEKIMDRYEKDKTQYSTRDEVAYMAE